MFGKTEKQTKPNPVHNFYDWINNTKKKDVLKDIITSEASTDKEVKEAKEKLKQMLDGGFYGRNKEKQEETCVMPKQFILLSQVSCIKGWDKKSGSKMYSNEIISTNNEDLIVKSFKGGTLFEGKYDKTAIEQMGGYFTKGLIVLEGMEMNEYYLKKGALYQRNEDIAKIDTNNYYVELGDIQKVDKGGLVDYVPTRKQGKKITDEDRAVAMEMVTFIEDYRSKDE